MLDIYFFPLGPAVLHVNQRCNEVAHNGTRSWTIVPCNLDWDADQILHLIHHLINHHLSLSYFQIEIDYPVLCCHKLCKRLKMTIRKINFVIYFGNLSIHL